jgi:16S rRNA (guanine966-N2)-methyltransferase
MRVVGGVAGGIPLHVPRQAGNDLRPTMDMVKNAIFSVLGESVEGTRVLDLFAGVGGLGIEALSRGARSCVFVESDRRACESIRRNLEKTRLTGGEVVSMEVASWLKRAAGVAAFDLILADPPYAKNPGDHDFTPDLLGSVALRAALKPGGIFVLEHLPGAALDLRDEWECARRKKYGATEVSFLRRPGQNAEPAQESVEPNL